MPRRLKQRVTRRSIIEQDSILDDYTLAGLQAGGDFDLVADLGAELDSARFELPGHGFDERAAVEATLYDRRHRHQDAGMLPRQEGRLCEHARLEATVRIGE